MSGGKSHLSSPCHSLEEMPHFTSRLAVPKQSVVCTCDCRLMAPLPAERVSP